MDNIRVGNTPVKRSLVTCMPGCYSSMARIKQAYRKAENLFFATEKMLAAAHLMGIESDTSDIEEVF